MACEESGGPADTLGRPSLVYGQRAHAILKRVLSGCPRRSGRPLLLAVTRLQSSFDFCPQFGSPSELVHPQENA